MDITKTSYQEVAPAVAHVACVKDANQQRLQQNAVFPC